MEAAELQRAPPPERTSAQAEAERVARIRELPGPAAWRQGAIVVVDRRDDEGLVDSLPGLPDDAEVVVRCWADCEVAKRWIDAEFARRDGGCSYLVVEPRGGGAPYLQTNDGHLTEADPAFAERCARVKADAIASGDLLPLTASLDRRDSRAVALSRVGAVWQLRREALQRWFPETAARMPDRAAYLAQFKRRSELGGTQVVVPASFWGACARDDREKRTRRVKATAVASDPARREPVAAAAPDSST